LCPLLNKFKFKYVLVVNMFRFNVNIQSKLNKNIDRTLVNVGVYVGQMWLGFPYIPNII